MPQISAVPGVYREDVRLEPRPVLQTAVPGFVGFATARKVPAGAGVKVKPQPLSRKEDFRKLFDSPQDGYLTDAVEGFFDNGGTHCYVAAVKDQTLDGSGVRKNKLIHAIEALAPLEDVDLVAVPDASKLERDDMLSVQVEALMHCARQGDRFAILDSPPKADCNEVSERCLVLAQHLGGPVNGALYYPWLVTSIRSGERYSVPPCGHVAGIYARCDARTGVFRAPANEEIFSVLDLESKIDDGSQSLLNLKRVNCLRAMLGRGMRVWGARTIGIPVGDDSKPADVAWLYVNVRRLFLTLRRWIDFNMGWAAFEPNDLRLWIRIRRELTVFLTHLLRDGALQGRTPREAFYVKCDAENNPPAVRDQGQVVIELGLAPLSPAEFIVIRIVRRVGSAPDQ